MIPLTSASTSDEVVIVEGGKVGAIHLVSRESLEQLIGENVAVLGGADWSEKKPLEESRLLLLFRAKAASLRASIALARAGEEPKKGMIGPSKALPVSESAAERAIDDIKKAWKEGR